MEITTIEQAKGAVEKWLKENHHNVIEIKNDSANFHFEVDFPADTQKKQYVIQPKDYPSMILLLSGVSIAPEHLEKIKNISEEELDSFYNEITKETIFLENSFEMNTDELGIVQQIQFSLEFYFDSLTKTQLLKGLLLNHKSLMYIVTKFNEKFGIPTVSTHPNEEMAGNI